MGDTSLPGPKSPWGMAKWAVRFQRDVYGGLMALHETYGPVVELGIGPLRYVYLFGREANEMVLADRPEAFSWHDAFKPLEVVDGPTALVLSDGEEHRRRRRLVQPAFHKRRIDSYIELMAAEADRAIDAWVPGRRIDVYTDLRAAVRRIVIRSLFGDELGHQAETLGDRLERPLAYIQRLPTSRRDLNLPGFEYRRVLADMKLAHDVVQAEVARRRASGDGNGDDGGGAGDVLAMLLEARDEDGSGLSDGEIRDQVMSLIAAGYDTTSAAAGWAVYDLLRHPDAWEHAATEVAEVVGDRSVRADDIPRLTYLDGVVNEVLRIHSPAVVAGRRSVEDVELHGHTIPAGRMVLYSAYVTHRLLELWPEPEAFRPERWDPTAPGYIEPAPYSWVPFGGGYRRCIGFAMATLELKVLLVQLLRRVDLALEEDDIRPFGIATMMPSGGVPVTPIAVRKLSE